MSAEPATKKRKVMSSWVEYAPDCDFPIQNLPWGIFSPAGGAPRVGVAIGDQVLDLSVLAEAGCFSGAVPGDGACFGEGSLNTFMGMGKAAWDATRATVTRLLSADEAELRDNADLRARALVPMAGVTMHMPAKIGDYTDFYSSREHATNVGTMFRGADNALQPNWLHLPVGYHGRSSSVKLSGTPVRRPRGQLQIDREDPKKGSQFGACKLMDFELEMAMFVGPGNEFGDSISIADADDHIFGLVLMNDWSARDIQKWEYVPLGPFTAKNFATTISPWVVPLAALEPFRCATSAGKQEDPVPLPYLQDPKYGSYDIKLEVLIDGDDTTKPQTVSRSNFANLYWNVRQQLVHHTVTGCDMQPGDLLGSGTISGQTQDAFGSMLELCWKGTREVPLGEEAKRKFLKDNDNVIMRGFCQGEGFRVGFGECSGKVLPAHATD